MKKLNIKSQPAETYVLADKEYERSRFYAIIESISARIIFGFTTGAFLAGFLKYIGAEDKLCGQISALTVLAGVIQFFSPFVLEKLNRRKAVVASFSAIHRFMLVMLVLVPVLPVSMIGRLYITAALYFVSHLMVNAVAPAATNLIISIVPQKMRGRYFSNREAYLIFASSVLNIIMGKVLDVFKLQNKTYEGYLIMYAVALAAMLLNLFSYIKIKEPPLPVSRKNINFKMLFSLPLKEKKFRKIIVLFFLWGLSLNFASPFFSVYMVSKLELSYTFIMISGFLNSLSYVIATRFWGRVADRFSFTYSAMLSIALLGITHACWFFASPDSVLLYPVVVLLHILSGIAWGGAGISLFNVPYEYTPEEGRTVYLGFNAALSGLVGFLSSNLSSWIVGAMENFKGVVFGMTITQFQLIFAASGLTTVLTALFIRTKILRGQETPADTVSRES
jgi:Na+/melibiose symporter-like transporter